MTKRKPTEQLENDLKGGREMRVPFKSIFLFPPLPSSGQGVNAEKQVPSPASAAPLASPASHGRGQALPWGRGSRVSV